MVPTPAAAAAGAPRSQPRRVETEKLAHLLSEVVEVHVRGDWHFAVREALEEVGLPAAVLPEETVPTPCGKAKDSFS